MATNGNEDGGKHVERPGPLRPPAHRPHDPAAVRRLLWNGEAGPGDFYTDPGSGGPENAWTTRNTVFMTWNILHFARMLKDAGGIPTYGNSTHDWDLAHPDTPTRNIADRRGPERATTLETMTVAASILLAAVVGGVIFVLLDSWQRRDATPAPPPRKPEPDPWQPEPPRRTWDLDDRRPPVETPGSLWSGWATRR